MCNAIKSKKTNTFLQAKKVKLKAKKAKKTSIICLTSYSGKRKSKHWLEPYLFGSNAEKKKKQV